MKKIYLSSPERLRKDRREIYERYGELCRNYGFVLLKMPDDLFLAQDTVQNSRKVAEKRLELIRECDIIIADARDFRSFLEPYSECGFELGIAYGLNKLLYAYMPDKRNYADRYTGEKHRNEKGIMVDENGISFEPGPLNVMLEYGCRQIIEGDLEAALKVISDDLKEAGDVC